MTQGETPSTEPDPHIADTMQQLLELGVLVQAKHEPSSDKPWWIRYELSGRFEVHLSEEGARGFCIAAYLVLACREYAAPTAAVTCGQ